MIQKLLCRLSQASPLFWYHKPEVIETYDRNTRKLRCVQCGQYFAMSDRHRAVLPWDSEIEAITRLMYGIPRSKV